MGKKSLTKSTTKKKTTAKKKAAPKTAAESAAPEKKVAPEKKAAPKKKAAPTKKEAAKKPTLKSLIKRDFGTWQPETLFAVSPDEDYLNNFSAPPVIDEKDKAKAKELRALLSRQFDLNVTEKPVNDKKAAPKKETPAPAKKADPAPKKALSIPELLKLQFETWQPKKMYTAKADKEFQKGFSAPPAIETTDKAEAARIKALLAKTFDLSVTAAEIEAAAKAEAKAKAEKEAAEKAKAEAKAKAEKEAAEKAKTEAEAKAKAEKEAAEIAKAEAEAKAKAEKEAAEKAKAEAEAEAKAKAEKEAAEKAKAEAEAKAKAEKEAAEKAKAEAEAEAKAKAEKEAAEKAKAEAEAKAKAEKAAAEKAKAEAEAKAKAEKAKAEAEAAAKREAQKAATPPAPPVAPKVATPSEPPMGNAVKMLIAIVGGLFGLLIIASSMNTNNYYLKPADNAVEIWQGKFSPSGEKLVMSVPGASVEAPVKKVYTKKEALVPAFNYYIGKAEALSEEKGLLDFEAIKSTLYQAMKYAPSNAHKKEVKTRLNKIDFLFLIYKADVAAGKNTVEGYKAALDNLGKANVLSADKTQKELLEKKTNEINEALTALQADIKAREAAAALEKEAAAALEKEAAAAREKEAEATEKKAEEEKVPAAAPKAEKEKAAEHAPTKHH